MHPFSPLSSLTPFTCIDSTDITYLWSARILDDHQGPHCTAWTTCLIQTQTDTHTFIHTQNVHAQTSMLHCKLHVQTGWPSTTTCALACPCTESLPSIPVCVIAYARIHHKRYKRFLYLCIHTPSTHSTFTQPLPETRQYKWETTVTNCLTQHVPGMRCMWWGPLWLVLTPHHYIWSPSQRHVHRCSCALTYKLPETHAHISTCTQSHRHMNIQTHCKVCTHAHIHTCVYAHPHINIQVLTVIMNTTANIH